jgi:ribosomal protein S18 acetylase RimI-like enzyme
MSNVDRTHLADRLRLPATYSARPYCGPADHPAMVGVLTAYREHIGDPEMPTIEQFDNSYGHLEGCDPATDIAVVECGGAPVAYCRTEVEDLGTGVRDGVVFSPTRPDHLAEDLFVALTVGQQEHVRPQLVASGQARFRAYATHPGHGRDPIGEAAWLETLGFEPTEWSAMLVRPSLDDVPRRHLPDGVEVRPVEEHHIRMILEAHFEAFRGEWDFREVTEEDIAEKVDDPLRDESLWKVAWAGDTVVGQVKSYINHEENTTRGYLRGYTEDISTHHDWRNRGIAGALLAMSLAELKRRGMTEAALGADTNNPGGAFHLYQSLGFEVVRTEAVYTRAV